jgi:putative nucleotidyltransferase with HDIG domain
MLKWVSLEQVRFGMYIHEIDCSWIKHPFWRRSFLLESADDLQLLHTIGIKRVRIDSGRGLDVDLSSAKVPGDSTQSVGVSAQALLKPTVARSARTVPLADGLVQAARLRDYGRQAVEKLYEEARLGNALDTSEVGNLVQAISASITRNPHALISLLSLKSKDDYTYLHSVSVCALMIALSGQLGLDEQQTQSAGKAGLLHDIGKAQSPVELLNKPGKLTAEEYDMIKQHAVQGHAMLVGADVTDPITLDVCLHHHEKVDGSGYPEGLRNEEISLFAKMGAVCDVYDAVTSTRPYNAGWCPAETIHRMAEWKGHFDMQVFGAFVKNLGIYPVGSLVRLESGRLGVVVDQNKKSLTTPKVKVFFSTLANSHLMPEIIDLSKQRCADRIVSRDSGKNWGLENTHEFWMDLPLSPKR